MAAPSTAGSAEGGFNHLLAAPSKDAVGKFFSACYRYRNTPSDAVACRHVTELPLTPLQAASLVEAGVRLVQTALYQCAEITGPEGIAARLPAGTDARLQALIASIVWALLPSWREAAVESRVSLPRLVSSSWRVDVNNASSGASALSVATVQWDVTVRDPPTSTTAMPATRAVSIELNHTSLGSLVEGMRRIRDQLALMH